MSQETTSLHFSEDLAKRMDAAMHLINNLTLINNKKIQEFHQRSEKMNPDIYDLATIVSAQHLVLEEKYKVLHALITDLYSRLENGIQLPDRSDHT
jgi:hypothetical protein